MVQKDLERITLTFFLLKQSNIFCTVISQAVVDICGRDRKGRQFFLKVGQEIRLLTRSAISRHLRVLSGTRKLEPVALIQLKEMLLNGSLMKLVMAYECELYISRLQERLLLHFLMMLQFHLTNQSSRIYVCGSYH